MTSQQTAPASKADQPVPGVYVRTGGQPADIDLLWNGSRTYFKDDRAGLFNLFVGFIAGGIVTSVLFLTVFNQPAFQRLVAPPPVVAEPQLPKTTIKPEHATVVVEKGETLSGIVDREYHNTAMALQKKVIASNHLEDNGVVQVGQVLRLPVFEQ
jgi:LysM repeat protein